MSDLYYYKAYKKYKQKYKKLRQSGGDISLKTIDALNRLSTDIGKLNDALNLLFTDIGKLKTHLSDDIRSVSHSFTNTYDKVKDDRVSSDIYQGTKDSIRYLHDRLKEGVHPSQFHEHLDDVRRHIDDAHGKIQSELSRAKAGAEKEVDSARSNVGGRRRY